jgi:hypothetical protein
MMGPGITERFSSRGAAFGDYDNDGDIDVLVLNMNDLPSVLRNDGGNQQNWIKLKLIGTKCNRTAIGTRVRVVTGKHVQTDEVYSGSSVMSQGDLRLHFGLGKVTSVDHIEVKWPTTGKIERFTEVKANQIIIIREGSGIVSTMNPQSKAVPPGYGVSTVSLHARRASTHRREFYSASGSGRARRAKCSLASAWPPLESSTVRLTVNRALDGPKHSDRLPEGNFLIG